MIYIYIHNGDLIVFVGSSWDFSSISMGMKKTGSQFSSGWSSIQRLKAIRVSTGGLGTWIQKNVDSSWTIP